MRFLYSLSARTKKCCIVSLWLTVMLAWIVYQRRAFDAEGIVVEELFAKVPFAVVRPVSYREIPALYNSRPTSRPCIGDTLSVDLVLHYIGTADDVHSAFPGRTVKAVLLEYAKREDIVDCFNRVRITYAELDDDKAPVIAACERFQSVFKTRSQATLWGYESIYYMELDVIPIRPGWLEQLLPRFDKAATGEVWVTGGGWNNSCIEKFDRMHPPVVLTPTRKGWYNKRDGRFLDNHINANAVYSAKGEFVEIIQGWDCHALPEYAHQIWKRWHNSNVTEKWLYDPFFMDCNPDGPFQGIYRSLPVVRILDNPAFEHVLLLHRGGDLPVDPSSICKNC